MFQGCWFDIFLVWQFGFATPWIIDVRTIHDQAEMNEQLLIRLTRNGYTKRLNKSHYKLIDRQDNINIESHGRQR